MHGDRHSPATQTRPERILLQMAVKDGDWAGVAIRFKTEEHHHFAAVHDLLTWLCRLLQEAPRSDEPERESDVASPIESQCLHEAEEPDRRHWTTRTNNGDE